MLHCPNRDGLLKKYTHMGTNGFPVTYHRCPNCRGFWLTSFAANFLNQINESPSIRTNHDLTFHPLCPECNIALTHARADAIAPGVNIWRCEKGHGYFFPAGQLSKFKQAQSAKLSYHKLWQIPLPSVASVLLASLAVLLASSTAIVANIRQKQMIQSQAQSIFKSQHAYVTDQGTVMFTISTNLPASVTLFVEVNNYQVAMDTTDGLSHTATVSTLPPGIYVYFFTIEKNGKQTTTKHYTVQIPSR